MKDELKNDMSRDPADLEREADRARANVEHTLEALERKLSPGQMVDQVLHVVKQNGGDFGRNLSTQVRNNPIPTVLTGIGLAWLMSASDRPPPQHSVGSSGPSMGERAGSAASAARGAAGHASDTARSAATGARSALGNAADRVRGALGSASHGTRSTMGSMAGATRSTAHNVAYSSRTGADSLIHGYDYLRREQPLVLGALAVAAGALIGAMLPSTRAEDEWIGEQSDEAAQRLKEQARHTADQAKVAAAEAAEAARHAAGPGRTGESGSDSGRQQTSRGEAAGESSEGIAAQGRSGGTSGLPE